MNETISHIFVFFCTLVVPQNYCLMVLNNAPWQLEQNNFKTVVWKSMCLPLTKMTLDEEYTGLWDCGYISLLNGLFICMARLAKTAHKSTKRWTSKLSCDGSLQWALAIRAKQFKDRCKEIIVSPTGPWLQVNQNITDFPGQSVPDEWLLYLKIIVWWFWTTRPGITAEQFQDRCIEINVSPINQDDLRWGIYRPLGLVGIFLF